MKWEQARKFVRLGGRLVGLPRSGPGATMPPASHTHRAASVCVASGKGGTGKSVLCASLSALLAERGRTLLVDADLGVGNAHILQDVSPPRSIAEVIDGQIPARETLVACREGLDLLSGGSGVSRLTSLSPCELQLLAAGLVELEREYAHLVLDSSAGISDQTVAFAAACDLVVLITTPDITAMTDAYAFMKVLLRRKPGARPLLVVNRTLREEEGRQVAARIGEVASKFLGAEPRWIGDLPDDRAVARSVAVRRPVVISEPGSEAAAALRELAGRIALELDRRPHLGVGRELRRDGRLPAATGAAGPNEPADPRP